MAEVVKVARRDGVAVVKVDNPPVNALGHAVRSGLFAIMNELRGDPEVRAIVIACEGRGFVAGADVKEFGRPIAFPGARAVISAIEDCGKPVVAAIHGAALGGGLELALACSHRVATADAKLGLPEVKLGLLPGAGGTQRLPRAVGVERAVRMIVNGEALGAEEALASGLIDEIVERAETGGVSFARHLLASGSGVRTRLRDDDTRLLPARRDRSLYESSVAAALKRVSGMESAKAAAEAIGWALDLPFDEALRKELEAFGRLLDGAQSRAQRYTFFAEREAAKPAVPRGTTARPVARVAVVGGGTMGTGIALSFANAGIPVTLIEQNDERVARSMAAIRGNYEAAASRGSLSTGRLAERLGLIGGAAGIEHVSDADLVIEAVFEDIEVKQDAFRRIDRHAKSGAVLATNTSYLDVDRIAAVTSRPEDVLGMHFFSPANVMRLCEVVRASRTGPEALLTARDVARKIGKVPVVVGPCDGFVGNRMLRARSRQVERLLLAGVSPKQIDAAVTGFGMPMGPLAMADLAGLDLGWRATGNSGRSKVSDALCEAGRFGQKNGKGYYRYDIGSRGPKPDPEVERIIRDLRERIGAGHEPVSASEVLERLLYPMMNEGFRILAEGVATRPGDIDAIWVHGYGWPAYRGGPMYHAEEIGLRHVADRLEAHAQSQGDPSLRPAALLEELVRSGASLREWTGGTG